MSKNNKRLATLVLGATLMSSAPVMGGTSTSSGCGAGKCGSGMKKEKDSQGACGAKPETKAPAQMACGAGKCGSNMIKDKDAQGTCGVKIEEKKPAQGETDIKDDKE